MSNTFTAPFAQFPKTNAVDVTAATAVGTAGTVLVTAGPDGCVVTSIRATPKGTITAVGINVNKAGKVARSESMPTYASATNAKLPQVIFDISPTSPIELAGGETLDVSLLSAQAAGITFFATWKDY